MTKKEIRNAINQAVYMYAERLGYQMSDDNDGSYVTFSQPDCKSVDDMIDYSRSYHECVVCNWASDKAKADAALIDKFAAATKADIEWKQAVMEGNVE